VIVGSNVYAPRRFLLKLRPSVTRVKQRKVEKSKVKRERRENAQNAMNRRIQVDGLCNSQFDTDFNYAKIIPEDDDVNIQTSLSSISWGGGVQQYTGLKAPVCFNCDHMPI